MSVSSKRLCIVESKCAFLSERLWGFLHDGALLSYVILPLFFGSSYPHTAPLCQLCMPFLITYPTTTFYLIGFYESKL